MKATIYAMMVIVLGTMVSASVCSPGLNPMQNVHELCQAMEQPLCPVSAGPSGGGSGMDQAGLSYNLICSHDLYLEYDCYEQRADKRYMLVSDHELIVQELKTEMNYIKAIALLNNVYSNAEIIAFANLLP